MTTEFFNSTVQWIAIGIFFFLLVYSTLQKPSEMQKHVTVLTIASILFLGGYLVRIESADIQTAMLGATISYMGQPFVMLSALMLIATFFGHKIPKSHFVLLACCAAAIPIVVYTNPHHYLFYATVDFDPDALHSPLITTHGPLYNVNLLLAFACFVAYIHIISSGYRKVKSPVRKRLSIYSILMVVSGVVGYLLYFLKLTNGYDTTMFGVSLGAVFLAVLFFRCRIFDIVDKAKDYALDSSDEGLVIFDDANAVIYENSTAASLMEHDIPQEYIDIISPFDDSPAKTEIRDCDDRHYSVCVRPITKNGDYLGKSVEMHDISDSINHRALLEEAVRVTTERLETVQRTIFGSIASIVEARSLETGDHIMRVSKYTEMIAQALRNRGDYADVLTDEYINTLTLSAPLHDVGKISIPDAILLKPAKLTPEEFEVMKTHAAKGAEIIATTMEGLESEEYISMATDIARYHHERWDGNGYPAGLQGERIPLSARIVALADCYDAMTSERCYKEAFPNREAIAIIRQERGSHFDPKVVDAFFALAEIT